MGGKVTASGPLFDGGAEKAVEDFRRAAEEEIGKEGVTMIQTQLDRVLRHPTGYYRSRITTERAGDRVQVTDGGVVYGPWLEGVGSRNKSTRFKGYRTFRLVAQQLQKKVGPIAERVLPGYLGRMK